MSGASFAQLSKFYRGDNLFVFHLVVHFLFVLPRLRRGHPALLLAHRIPVPEEPDRGEKDPGHLRPVSTERRWFDFFCLVHFQSGKGRGQL